MSSLPGSVSETIYFGLAGSKQEPTRERQSKRTKVNTGFCGEP